MTHPRIALTFQLPELDELFNALKVTEVNQRALQPGLLDQLLQDVGRAADRLRQAAVALDSQRAKGDLLRAAGYPNLPAVPCPPVEDSRGLPSITVDSLAGMTPADKLFAVIEYSSFFAVRHLPSGAECPMGDGVDALSTTGEERHTPGTEDFIRQAEVALNLDPMTTLNVYFPELVDQPEEVEGEDRT